MTSTVYNEKPGIRTAFVNCRTTDDDIEIVKKLMISVTNIKYIN